MKIFFLLLFSSILSCEHKADPEKKVFQVEEKTPALLKSEALKEISTTDWFQYYKNFNPSFKTEHFKLQETSKLSYQKSNVNIFTEKNFNAVYEPFLIFNESDTQYLDFDSYHWFLEEDGAAGFEADQQVALVNIKQKSAKQIAFFGPSYFIEDALWKGDSVAVLLGNSYDKVPFIMKFNFENSTVKHYQYADTLQFKTNYATLRLRQKGIKVQ